MTSAPGFAANGNGFLDPLPMSDWVAVNTMWFDTWMKWQGVAWQSCQELQAEWIRQWVELARDWPASFVGMRGTEQLA